MQEDCGAGGDTVRNVRMCKCVNVNHNNLYLSIASFLGSICSYLVAFVTDYHIMGVVGFVSLLVSIRAGYLTIKEKRMSIQNMEDAEKHIHRKG